MKTKEILKWPLIVGIVIVLNLFYLYAIKVAYPKPEYDNFCPKEQVVKKIGTEAECLEIGGQWREDNMRVKPVSVYEGEMVTIESEGYCNQNFICSQQFDDARENYEENVFVALIILGVLTIIAGFLTMKAEVISVALSLGGVLSFVIASIRYWQYASDWTHLGILGIALLTLVWLGIKKFKE
ncbi:MAG: hypothetical protein KAV41_01210 [Candidatus Pacebacteria bacterium]|nr:hypothetical protein [Candidatus Paceibacterota bacterium]